MRVGLVQLCSGDDPAKNLPKTQDLIREATAGGAEFVLTPEVTNCVSTDRARQEAVLNHEADDPTLASLRAEAADLGIWLLIGSLALKTGDPDGRFANRGFMISPSGEIMARYDKIHMFDVTVSKTESYRESAGYRPGRNAVVTQAGSAKIGMTICYDARFPYLYRDLAQSGAEILTVPSAFSTVTGAAHWETLLRARAIETGAFVLAPAQCGQNTPKRATFGHSLCIDPWGRVLADGGTEPGVTLVDLDLADVEKCRGKIPSLFHDAEYESPE